MLREAPERLARIIDLLVDAICAVDADGRFVYISAAGAQVFGRDPAEMLGRSMLEFLHSEDIERTQAAAAEVMAGQPLRNFHNRYLRGDGSAVDLLWSARWLPEEGLRIAVARDISELKRSERRQAALFAIAEACRFDDEPQHLLDQLQTSLATLFCLQRLWLVLADSEGWRLLQAGVRDPPSTPPALEPVAIAELLLASQPLQRPGAEPGTHWIGLPLIAEAGVQAALQLEMEGAAEEADLGLLRYTALQLAQALRRRADRAHLQHLAQHDPLTDLPNRAALREHLHRALLRAAALRHRLAVLYLDLDAFKPINDRLGHAVGDALLRGFAQRLRANLRPGDFVGRIGGDEFVVVLEPIGRSAEAEQLARSLSQRLAEPLDCEGFRLPAVPSVGLALYPEHGDDAEALLRAADAAMYRAKAEGGGRIRYAAAPPPASGSAAISAAAVAAGAQPRS
jgi:diguanylate cyclase (GGDEF)-like protein/PAS domain S-box-containing protein